MVIPGAWLPQAKIRHQIPESRSSQEYVYDYFVGQGRALVANNRGWHQELEKMKAESSIGVEEIQTQTIVQEIEGSG